MNLEAYRQRLRQGLLDISVRFGDGVDRQGKPYGWLLDCRELLLQGDYLHYACALLWERLRPHQPDVVGGLTLAANPLTLGLMYESRREGPAVDGVLIRREPKADGLKRQVEGPQPRPGQRVALVDDILNSGETQRQAFAALRPFNVEVPVVGVLIDYEGSGHEWLKERGYRIEALFTLAELGVAAGPPPEPGAARVLWTFPGLNRGEYSAPKSRPALHNGRLYVGGDRGLLVALDEHGREQWRFETRDQERGVHSSPCLAGDKVIFGAYDGYLYALAQDTGQLQWEVRPGQWIGSSPVAHPTLPLVYVGIEFGESGGSLIAVDPATGQTRWELPAGDYVHATPGVAGDRVLCGSNDGILRCADAATGEPLWEFATGGALKAQTVVEDGLAFVCSFDGHLYAVDVATGAERWRRRLGAQAYCTPACHGPHVLAGGSSGRLLALDRQTGRTAWIAAVGGSILGGVAVTGDHVVVGSTNARICVLAAPTGRLLWTHTTGGRILGQPAVDGARFFLPSCDGVLYACERSRA